jgi:glycosyltransferase involved in cell wall biosynthesis
MRILFLVRSLGYGGAERQVVEVAVGLKKRGHTVFVACFYPGGPFEKELIQAGISVESLEKKTRWKVLSVIRNLNRICTLNRIECVYSVLEGPNIFAAFLKILNRRIKVVWWLVHSGLGLNNQHWSSTFANILAARLSRFSDLIISNSTAGKLYAINSNYHTDKIQIVYNGVNLVRFDIRRAKDEDKEKLFGFPPSSEVIGIVGRIDPVKGHKNFIDAAEIVASQISTARFVVVGDGDKNLQKNLQEITRHKNIASKFKWLNGRPDIEVIYNCLDVLCLTSLSEGLPNVICEAMACGVPCATTNVGDAAAVVGELGAVSETSSPQAIADCILGLLANRGSINRMQLRERINLNYSEQKFVTETESLLMKCITNAN